MDERSFYNESRASRSQDLNCPFCKTTQPYDLEWLIRLKKDRLPGNADERDRARFAKAQSYMVLLDDKVACKNVQCRKRIEVSGIKTTAFLNAEQEQTLRSTTPSQQPAKAKQPDGNRRSANPKNSRNPKQKQKQNQNQKQKKSFRGRSSDNRGQSGNTGNSGNSGNSIHLDHSDWQGSYLSGNRQQTGSRKGGAKKKRPKYIGVYQRPAPGREF